MNLLDKTRFFEGSTSLREKFTALLEDNPSQVSNLVNDPELSFTSLYIIKDDVKKSNLVLNERNQAALRFCDNVIAHKIMNRREIDHSVVKWIFQTGFTDDGLNNEFDNIIDIASSILIVDFKDYSILPALSHIIFKRNRMGTFNLYLTWVFFMSGKPESLLLVANKLLSNNEADVKFAKDLLNFIPADEITAGDLQRFYGYVLDWVKNNHEKLLFTGESFQFSSKPVIFQTDGLRPAVEAIATVRGVSIDFDALLNEYPQGSIERLILQKIHSGRGRYNYDSLEQLKFEIRLRAEIIKASYALFNSGMSFEVFRDAKANPAYWTVTEEGGFLLRDDVKPSDAVRDFYFNGWMYGTECATAMVIVYYMALLNIFPENLFNDVFRKIHLMNWHYIDRNLREIGFPRPVSDFIPGDRLYVINPDVNPQTPWWQGENLIYLDDDSYYGHGLGIGDVDYFIEQLNRNRKEDADESAYLMAEAARPDFKRLAEIYYSAG